jgi:hypothetical protein
MASLLNPPGPDAARRTFPKIRPQRVARRSKTLYYPKVKLLSRTSPHPCRENYIGHIGTPNL